MNTRSSRRAVALATLSSIAAFGMNRNVANAQAMPGMNMDSTATGNMRPLLVLLLTDGEQPEQFSIRNLSPDDAPTLPMDQQTRLIIINDGAARLSHRIVIHPDGKEEAAVFDQDIAPGQLLEHSLRFVTPGLYMAMCHTGGPGHDRMMISFRVGESA